MYLISFYSDAVYKNPSNKSEYKVKYIQHTENE
jgi:hypothetical protein